MKLLYHKNIDGGGVSYIMVLAYLRVIKIEMQKG